MALQQTNKPKNDRTPYIITNNYVLRQIPSIVKRYFPIPRSSIRCNEAFANPPLISYRRPKNLCDYLAASVPPFKHLTNPVHRSVMLPVVGVVHTLPLTLTLHLPHHISNTHPTNSNKLQQTPTISNKLTCATENLNHMIQDQ